MIYESDLSSFKISYKKKITEALKKLSLINPPILFVVDKKNDFIGTVTDGDIRRHILINNELSVNLDQLVNKKPIICNYRDSKKKIFYEKILNQNNLKGIPVLKSKKIIGAFLAVYKNSNPTSVLIMAGGKGKRLLPLTKYTPKPLLKIHGRPILQHIIENIKSENFINVFVSVNYQSNKIKNFFKINENFGLNVKFLEERKPLGTAGSLMFLKRNKIYNDNIIVINADVLTDLKLKKILSYHIDNKCLITIGSANYKHQIPFGVIKNKNGKFNKIEEKPVYNELISSGIYVLNKKVLSKMKKLSFINMDKLIGKFTKNNIGIFPFYEYEDWIDLGNKSDFNKASNRESKNK
jgi:dTDP-glucose pyrophosphorylase